MHPHHKRALRASRRHVNQMAKTHAWALEIYQNTRERHLHLLSVGCAGNFEQVKEATAALEQVTRDYLDVLAVGITVEHALRNA